MEFGIFVVNLDRSTERLEKISSELSKYHQAFIRVPAIDGSNPNELVGSGYSQALNNRRYHKPLGQGEIACVESHKKALSMFLASDYDYALILEDDAIATYDVFDDLTKALRCIHSWDVIKLYLGKKTKTLSYRKEISPSLSVGIPKKVPNSTLAQLISRQGANKLIDIYTAFGEPADVCMKKWWLYDLVVLSAESSVFLPDEVESEINAIAKRDTQVSKKVRRLMQKLGYEIGNHTHKYDQLISKQFIKC